MAARRNTAKPAEGTEPETIGEKVADICRACWPHGWPHLSHSASCEHGTYVRDGAPEGAGSQATETKVVAADTEKAAEDAPPAGDKTEA